jgi:hypothetical protein
MLNSMLRARAFLADEKPPFLAVDERWQQLLQADDLSLARAVLSRQRTPQMLLDGGPSSRSVKVRLGRQKALLTSSEALEQLLRRLPGVK